MYRSVPLWIIELEPHVFLRAVENGNAVWGGYETSLLFRSKELALEMICALRIEKAKVSYVAIGV